MRAPDASDKPSKAPRDGVARCLLRLAAMRIALRLCLIAAAGCTSSAGGAVTGQPPGGTFQTADTISAAVTVSDGAGGTTSSAQIVLASTPHLCSDAGASPPIDRKLQRFITLDLRDVTGSSRTAPAAPGTYTIYPDTGSEPPKSASLATGSLDATCQPADADAASAQSGTVTLTSVTGGAFAGSFDVVLNTGGHLSGSFDPEPCPQLAAAVTSTDPHSCQ